MQIPANYIGRFAPSPSGDLHFGSLVAALASYCDAHHHHGHWFVRVDNIDPPREVAGSKESILDSLCAHGFDCNDVRYQSMRYPLYQDALQRLNLQAKLYSCQCSRKALKQSPIYPGICRPQHSNTQALATQKQQVEKTINDPSHAKAIRACLNGTVKFNDAVQGAQTINLDNTVGDTVLLRRDKLFAYALACAVDDSEHVSHVVRGSDLLLPTATQIAVMHLLEQPVPQYAHVPVALNAQQQKLSKQNKAMAIDNSKPLLNLHNAWVFLGQPAFTANKIDQFWQHAIALWDINLIPKTPTRPATEHVLS